MNRLQHTRNAQVHIFRIPADYGQHDYMKMRDHIRSTALQDGQAQVILDCADLDDPPSIAFGVFCGITRDAARAGGKCILVNANARMQSVMSRTHINEQVMLAATVEAGMQAFDRREEAPDACP